MVKPRSESLDDFFHKLLEPFTQEEIRQFRSKNTPLPYLTETSEILIEVEELVSNIKPTIDKTPGKPISKLRQFCKHRESRHDCISTSDDDKCNICSSYDQLLNIKRKARRERERKFREILSHKSFDSTSKRNNFKKQSYKTKRQNNSNWKERVSPDGQIYFHNSRTNQQSWEKPDELKTPSEKLLKTWKEYNFMDGTKFFYNAETREATWKIPGKPKENEQINKRVNKSMNDVPERLKNIHKENKPLSAFKRKLIEAKSSNDEIEKISQNTFKKGMPRNILVKTALVCVREALSALNDSIISGENNLCKSELSCLGDEESLSTI